MSDINELLLGISQGKQGSLPSSDSNYYINKGREAGIKLREREFAEQELKNKLYRQQVKQQILNAPILNPNSINYLNELTLQHKPVDMPFFNIKE